MPAVDLKQKRRAPARKSTSDAERGLKLLLPSEFSAWFKSRGWSLRSHQLELLKAARERRSTLLIAPTGAGKTLAGFLPTLVELAKPSPCDASSGVHTLYISPLKALAVDVARNLTIPVQEMGLSVRIDTRTGDTSSARKQRQRARPPQVLLTTPEQIALLLSHEDAGFIFANLKTVILDELHALAASKRGDLLALGLTRLRALAPGLMIIGLSATVARPSQLRSYLVQQEMPGTQTDMSGLVVAADGAKPRLQILESANALPWAGHTARYAVVEIYEALKAHRLTLLFVNTRSQAELLFQELWAVNEDTLAIGLHHGSLAAVQRRKVEAAMAAGTLRAVVSTSTLDLGVDWGDVDLVINVGAPKGASRLMQRIGRANHRLDDPSKALLVPGNRFEVLECRAAIDAANAGEQDAELFRTGAIDVLAQHVFGMACSGPFYPSDLFAQVRSAAPYAWLGRDTFDLVIDFVSTGGYALRAYERYAKLRQMDDGRLRISHPRFATQFRLNIGTIVEAELMRMRLVRKGGAPKLDGHARAKPLSGGRHLGEIDEFFISELSTGDTFFFAGQVVRLEGIRGSEVYVSKGHSGDPKIPSYSGGRFPLSTHLAARVRAILANAEGWQHLPESVGDWLSHQAHRSQLPSVADVLVETFPRHGKHYLVVYPFEGRIAHQTLGMLLTRRLARMGARPLGFVANDYGLAIWCLSELDGVLGKGKLNQAGQSLTDLFSEDMLGDDLDAWLAESNLMKRTFRSCAIIAGLIERRHPGQEKSGRQVTFSTNLIYDVLRQHDPHHILLEAAWTDAATGLLDLRRLSDFLSRMRGKIIHRRLSRASPLSVPILLEIGREQVGGADRDALLRDAADSLIAEAMED